jgi:outer membrane lipoprotein-sorting protein
MTLCRVGRAAVTMALAIAGIAGGAAAGPASPEKAEAPPANLVSGDAAHGAALDPVFAHFKLARLACTFSEEKHIALLAKPLRSSGTIHYDRDKGIARATRAPRPEHVVVTRTTLRVRKGDRTEEIPLDKSKDLRAFALIFPTVLRGERGELERSFDIGLYGSAAAWWALAFTPKTDSLRGLVRRVVVFGRKAELVALQVVEASGDTTDTQLSEIRTNGAVPDAEIASAFGAP